MAEPAPQYDTHVVIADFEGTAENELTVTVGEKLLVLQSTSEGWAEGYTTDGRQGWFPSAYAKFDPMGRGDVMEEIKEVKSMSDASQTEQNQSNTNEQPMSMQAAAKKMKMTRPERPDKKKKKEDNPFPGIRHHATDTKKKEEKADSPFPGIRHHPNPSPFPGIRHHTPPVDEKAEKRKKAEEKKKAKEQKKKDKELKKDLLMGAAGLFGVPLKAAVAQEQHETCIPFIVRACVEHILKGKNLVREGLFRISGIKTEIDSLKSYFESGMEAMCLEALAKADIDAVAGVLKLYLRELPDPLFTYKHHSQFVKAGTEQNLAVIKSTMGMLPPGHKETLLLVLGFLLKLSEYQDVNMMSETNIGIVFAPTIMKCPSDDENDDPEALKEAFFYVLHQSAGLLKEEPRIEKLLNGYYEANTCASSSSNPNLPYLNSSVPHSACSSREEMTAALPPPPLSSGPSNPSVSSSDFPPPIQALPPPILH